MLSVKFPDEEEPEIREKCFTPRNTQGVCIPLSKCQPLKGSKNFDLLRKSICGFNEKIPKICCPELPIFDTTIIYKRPTQRPTQGLTQGPTQRPIQRSTQRSTRPKSTFRPTKRPTTKLTTREVETIPPFISEAPKFVVSIPPSSEAPIQLSEKQKSIERPAKLPKSN